MAASHVASSQPAMNLILLGYMELRWAQELSVDNPRPMRHLVPSGLVAALGVSTSCRTLTGVACRDGERSSIHHVEEVAKTVAVGCKIENKGPVGIGLCGNAVEAVYVVRVRLQIAATVIDRDRPEGIDRDLSQRERVATCRLRFCFDVVVRLGLG